MASPRVVMTTSTSLSPQASFRLGMSASLFFAVQGMTEITRILWGSTPIRSAKKLFATAPNIAWGDFAVERFRLYSGNWDFTKRTQPGQQEVNIGHGY